MNPYFEVHYDKNLDIWVSYDPEHDLYSQGTTKDEALAAIEDTIRLYEQYLEDCDEKNRT